MRFGGDEGHPQSSSENMTVDAGWAKRKIRDLPPKMPRVNKYQSRVMRFWSIDGLLPASLPVV